MKKLVLDAAEPIDHLVGDKVVFQICNILDDTVKFEVPDTEGNVKLKDVKVTISDGGIKQVSTDELYAGTVTEVGKNDKILGINITHTGKFAGEGKIDKDNLKEVNNSESYTVLYVGKITMKHPVTKKTYDSFEYLIPQKDESGNISSVGGLLVLCEREE